MKHSYLRGSVCAAVSLGLAAFGTAGMVAPAYAAEGEVSIDFAAISDFHGHLENAAQLDYQIEQMRAANPNTHFISVGDNVGGSAYVSAVDNDTPTLEILKAMGLEVTASGNHEFDKGYDDLATRIEPALGVPVLAANAVGADTVNDPYVIMDYDGVKVAYIGTVTDEMPTLVSPSAIEGITFGDPVKVTNDIADQLKDGDPENGEADVVVALMHKDRVLGPQQLNANVDLAFGGHSHIEGVGTTAGGAPACQPVNYGTAFIKANVTVAADGTVSASCEVAAIDDNKSADIDALYQAADAKAKILGGDPVGYFERQASRGSRTGEGGEGSNRGTESPASNFIANVFYEYGKTFDRKPDFGVMNPGGVRADFTYEADAATYPKDDTGLLTKGESITMQPWGNVYGMLDITGAQIYTLLEQQWKEPTDSHPMLTLGLSSNVQYTYDPDAAQGAHILEVYIDDELVPNDDSRTYTVASSTFLLEGGDGFTVLEEGTNFLDTGMIDSGALNEYLGGFTKDDPAPVDYTQRSVGLNSYPTEVKAGSTVTFDVSSLAMTAGEPVPSSLQLELVRDGFSQIVEVPVTDVAPDADGYNEAGKARVSFTLRADAPLGEMSVRLKTDDGTVTWLPDFIVVKADVPAVNTDDEHNAGSGSGAGDKDGDGKSQPQGSAKANGKLSDTGSTIASVFAAMAVALLGGAALVIPAKRREL
ncbi:MAG: 5'-nucleotidase C-terminal domain-containing protein [Actinomycetaceae bacterium]|nr:5'-nucleotidase C-terminal domain-containing protein [Arcanobacterium sp.]MDD7505099.1 5'-nucleotidase C-terminal domain-containing protein [Actinomycetaceae bacterium]MDY6142616.1 5'-nucleotidase C-terminal domain-containing protein [Arcanobacterium sp.]